MVLASLVSTMAQSNYYPVTTITTNTSVWKDVDAHITLDASRIDFYYPGHHLTVHSFPNSMIETVDSLGMMLLCGHAL